MIRDFFFVLRVLVYSAMIALIMQVEWKGESLEQKAMRWVTQSSLGSKLTSTAQRMAWKLSRQVDETSRNVNVAPAAGATSSPKARTLIELKRHQQESYQEPN